VIVVSVHPQSQLSGNHQELLLLQLKLIKCTVEVNFTNGLLRTLGHEDPSSRSQL